MKSPVAPSPLPQPLGLASWKAVVVELRLAPQQERVVQLLMLSKPDKQIARELGLALPTVRTYLKRIFGQAGVEDRLALVHRVYSIAIGAWGSERHHPS